MTEPGTDRLGLAIAEAFNANRDYYRIFFNDDSDQALGPPAREEDICGLESRLNWLLPPSYREFLLRHDGWQYFRGDAHLIAISQRDEPGMRAHLAEFRDLTRQAGDLVASAGFVILAGEESTTLAYLDPPSIRPDGEMEVVVYSYHDGELARYPDFVALLEASTATLLRLIDRETGGRR